MSIFNLSNRRERKAMKQAKSKMRIKLLDLTLMSILGGFASYSFAQDAQPQLVCGDTECSSNGQTVIKLVSKGETQSSDQTDQGLQAQRKVEITQEVAGRSYTTRVAMDVPGGGKIWATEDPQLAVPQLSVSAPGYAAFEGGKIVKPVSFNLSTNYSTFVQRYEVLIYRGNDSDLVTPLAKVDVKPAAIVQFSWDGAMSTQANLREGEDLQYIVRAYDAKGNYDETYPRQIQLLRQTEVDRLQNNLRANASGEFASLSADEIQARQLLAESFGQNQLRQQNIEIYGSRIRVRGEGLADGAQVSINGEAMPIDRERKFVAEYLMPVGKHSLVVETTTPGGESIRRDLNIDVTGRYMFAVALADITASDNSVGGAVVPVGLDDRYDEFLTEGRLAVYLKGKVKGKYLITAQADTREREIEELFSGFLDEDARDVFRRLDPDQYYPVYGDDSTTYRDVDTQGKLYVRVDWNQNQALWGNYQTGFTGTEFGQYTRSLYGAALSWRSRQATDIGEAKAVIKAFGSETQTAAGHSEFLGTGGSLYYLRHTDLLPGSQTVVLEVRDPRSTRVEARVTLREGVDYEIDDLQGRIILTRPLTQIARDNLPTITRDAPLDGFENRLLADYEYVPSGFSLDNTTTGFRGKGWLGDHFAVGGTYVDENRSGDDYSLRSVDLTLQAGRGTYLKVEQAESESTGVPIFFSDNGGLSFTQLNSIVGPRSGDATSVEARANFKELGWSSQEWSAGAWWRDVDGGFSLSRFDNGTSYTEQGAEVVGNFTDTLRMLLRYSDAERGADSFEQANLLLEWRIRENDSFTGELRHVSENVGGVSTSGDLLALRYSKRFGSSFDLYGIGQLTLDDDGGRYAENDAFTLGARYLARNQSSLAAEWTTGDRGDAARIEGEYRISPEHAVYAGYTYSTDTTAGSSFFNTRQANGLTLGQRWRISNQVNLYNESQFLKQRNENGIAHTFGMDFYPSEGWNLGFTLQTGELESATGTTDRDALSVSVGRTNRDTQWNSKLEYRRDTGAERRKQWVSTNRFFHKINSDWRVAFRFNYSDTDDNFNPLADAKFIEGNAGFAYRPVANDRWSLLGKVTYLYDLASLGQESLSNFDQRSTIYSMEGIYRLNDRWEFAGKLARREGEARLGRGAGVWFDNSADFAALQTRYDLVHKWDGLLEYRWLQVDGGDSSRKGWLVGVDREITDNFRVGVGYNFTDFADNLTVLDYDQKGWFLNLTGVY
jgi:hypothetical protein